MNPKIHPTALVDSSAEIAPDVVIGPYAIVEAKTRIAEGCIIDAHVRVAEGTTLGRECHVFQGAILGSVPQDLKFGGEDSYLNIGERTTIREYATLNRGTEHGGLHTTVGDDCLIMAYGHIAHDCHIGNSVIFANCSMLAGHVTLGDFVNVSGLVAIHQFVKVGNYSYIGGLARVSQDLPPYILAGGEPLGYRGPNVVGLRRKGFTSEQIATIKKAYSYIYRTKLNLKQAVDKLKSEMTMTAEVEYILEFIDSATRGITGRGSD
ncbi:acyl-ACP--UDP-N-acetylglucosamine O-acyltransferase [Calditrichota bacterium]